MEYFSPTMKMDVFKFENSQIEDGLVSHLSSWDPFESHPFSLDILNENIEEDTKLSKRFSICERIKHAEGTINKSTDELWKMANIPSEGEHLNTKIKQSFKQLSPMDTKNGGPHTFCCGPFRVSMGTATYVSAVICFVLELILAGYFFFSIDILSEFVALFFLACAFSYLVVIYGQKVRNPNLFAPCLSLEGIRLILTLWISIWQLECAISPNQMGCNADIKFWRDRFPTASKRLILIVDLLFWALPTVLIGCFYYIIFRGFNALRKQLYKWPPRPSNPVVDG
uniref:MARVEL domain-containing protein n=1 Tax=Globodera pallida TaxID=36090 RepID=A0A183C638_GLOPA